MRIFIISLLIPCLVFAGPTGTWSGSTTHQFFPTIIKALLGNGFALLPSQALVGDCSDGDVTISSGVTTLVRDMYYNNLTINGTGTINVSNQRIFVCGTFDISSAPANALNANGANGNNATVGTAGTGGAVNGAGTNMPNKAGGAGATGVVGVGAIAAAVAQGNAIAATSTTGSGGSGGAGGAGTSGAGGAQRARTAATAFPMRDILTWFLPQTGGGVALITSGSAPGGSSGAGDGTNVGGGGGGGGASGSTIYLSANIIKTSGSTPSGVISANGGNGGNGGSPSAGNAGGGGGGGGGAGGWIVVKYNSRTGATVTNGITANGGSGGTGGTKTGTGVNGNNGNTTLTSQPGLIQTLDFSTGAINSNITGSVNL